VSAVTWCCSTFITWTGTLTTTTAAVYCTGPQRLYRTPKTVQDPEGCTGPRRLYRTPKTVQDPEDCTGSRRLYRTPKAVQDPEDCTGPPKTVQDPEDCTGSTVQDPEGCTGPRRLYRTPEDCTGPQRLYRTPKTVSDMLRVLNAAPRIVTNICKFDHLNTPSRYSLWPAGSNQLIVPQVKLPTYGRHAFSVTGLTV